MLQSQYRPKRVFFLFCCLSRFAGLMLTKLPFDFTPTRGRQAGSLSNHQKNPCETTTSGNLARVLLEKQDGATLIFYSLRSVTGTIREGLTACHKVQRDYRKVLKDYRK